jgi:hypothetical protein
MTGANSGEEFFEVLPPLSHYMAMDVSQPVGNWHVSELLWSGLTEAYAEGGCEVHVHFCASIVNSGIAGDWCAIFNRAEDWFDFIDCDAQRYNKAESRSCEKRSMG